MDEQNKRELDLRSIVPFDTKFGIFLRVNSAILPKTNGATISVVSFFSKADPTVEETFNSPEWLEVFSSYSENANFLY